MVAGPRFLLRRLLMTTSTLLAPAQWAQTEFALAELGDRRRTQRLVKMARALAHCPGGTLPQAFSEVEGSQSGLSLPEPAPGQLRTHPEPALGPDPARLSGTRRVLAERIRRNWTTPVMGRPRTWALSAMAGAGACSCIARWPCGWRRGPWTNGPQARSWACWASSAGRGQDRPVKNSARRGGSA